MGGLHWMNMPLGDTKTPGTVKWEGKQLEDLNVKEMVGGHCTGYERVIYLRTSLGLDPVSAPLAGVGNTVSPAGWGFGWTLNVTKPLLDAHGDGALMCYQGFHGEGHDQ
jgi:hypothetical protein